MGLAAKCGSGSEFITQDIILYQFLLQNLFRHYTWGFWGLLLPPIFLFSDLAVTLF